MAATPDGDLMLCPDDGVAYQADRTHLADYDRRYYEKCESYEGQDIERKINAARIDLVARWFSGPLLDVGIGSGAFIKARGDGTLGFDVNPVAIEWLKRNDLFSDRLDQFGALTFWDVLEHCPDPGVYLSRVALHAFVFCSLPVFASLAAIRESKHYRPGEHLQYYTEPGFIDWMRMHGFLLLEVNYAETLAGRESIASFAFKRHRWPR